MPVILHIDKNKQAQMLLPVAVHHMRHSLPSVYLCLVYFSPSSGLCSFLTVKDFKKNCKLVETISVWFVQTSFLARLRGLCQMLPTQMEKKE